MCHSYNCSFLHNKCGFYPFVFWVFSIVFFFIILQKIYYNESLYYFVFILIEFFEYTHLRFSSNLKSFCPLLFQIFFLPFSPYHLLLWFSLNQWCTAHWDSHFFVCVFFFSFSIFCYLYFNLDTFYCSLFKFTGWSFFSVVSSLLFSHGVKSYFIVSIYQLQNVHWPFLMVFISIFITSIFSTNFWIYIYFISDMNHRWWFDSSMES